jgi:glycosyltransferase involved in cell wall biosynthesis
MTALSETACYNSHPHMISGKFKEFIRSYYLRWLYFPLFPARRPKYFLDPWKSPAAEPRPTERNPDILFLPMTDWHTRIQRTQHLARAFAARGHRCFYLNPHLGREFPETYPFTHSPQLRELEPRIFELHVHLPLEPVFHERLLSAAESARISSSIMQVLDQAGSTRLVQILSFPTWAGVARQIREQRNATLVYDCHDVLSGFRNIAPEIVASEPAIFSDSDLVLFSAELLREHHKAEVKEGRSLLVRNAVDENLLRKGITTSPAMERVAGYIGALDFWFDVDSMEQAARRHTNWKFVLVGRVEDARVHRLRELPNVEFTGEVAHSELPRLLAGFRIALIPFLRNSLTLGTNPIKLYEYFSYGLPVVATRLPELEPFSRLVYLYEGAAEFGTQFERAIAEKDLRLRAERQHVVMSETWPARVAQLDQALAGI